MLLDTFPRIIPAPQVWCIIYNIYMANNRRMGQNSTSQIPVNIENGYSTKYTEHIFNVIGLNLPRHGHKLRQITKCDGRDATKCDDHKLPRNKWDNYANGMPADTPALDVTRSSTGVLLIISMSKYKKDATPLLTHLSYVFLALTHRYQMKWWCSGLPTVWIPTHTRIHSCTHAHTHTHTYTLMSFYSNSGHLFCETPYPKISWSL